MYTAMTTAEPSVAVNITSLTNASCTGPCYVANYGALVHTFNPVQTITTATLIAYVTILSSGTNATSISTRTANITLSPNSSYVSASDPLTSVVSGFTFTYPSYAIEYRNIQGYVYTMTSVNDQSTCTLENVLLPPLAASNTFVAMDSSLVPYAGDQDDPHIPPQVIDNLNKIPEVAAILHTSNINSCVNAFVPKTSSCETEISQVSGVLPVASVTLPGGSIKQDMVKALTTTVVALATGDSVVVSATAAAQVKSPAASTTPSQPQWSSKDNNGLVEGGQDTNQPLQPGLPSPGGQAKPSQETFESSLGQSPNPAQEVKTQYSQHAAPLPAKISTTTLSEGIQTQQSLDPVPTQASHQTRLDMNALAETAQPQSFLEPSPASPGEPNALANLEKPRNVTPLSTPLLQSITASSQVFTLLPGSSGYIVDSEDLKPISVLMANGVPISLPSAGSLLIVVTSIVGLYPEAPTITAGPQTAPIPSVSLSRHVVNGQNLVPGGAVTVDGVLMSWPVFGLVLVAEGSTVPLQTAVVTISADYTASVLMPGSYTGFVISGQSLASGNAVTVNSVTISLPTSGSVVIAGSSTIGIGATEVVAAGGQALTFLPDPSFGSAIGGQTIVPVQHFTVSGVSALLLSSGSSFAVDGSTIQPGTTELVTAASQIFTLSAGPSSRFIINSETLTPGQDITINSIRISLFPSDSSVIIGTSTIPLRSNTEKIPSIGSQALTIAEGASSALVVNGQTITPGEGEVIDGVTVSLPLSGTAAAVDTSSVRIGSLSSSGLGFGPTSTGTPTATGNLSVVGSTGGASSLKETVGGWWIWMIGVLVSCWMASS